MQTTTSNLSSLINCLFIKFQSLIDGRVRHFSFRLIQRSWTTHFVRLFLTIKQKFSSFVHKNVVRSQKWRPSLLKGSCYQYLNPMFTNKLRISAYIILTCVVKHSRNTVGCWWLGWGGSRKGKGSKEVYAGEGVQRLKKNLK